MDKHPGVLRQARSWALQHLSGDYKAKFYYCLHLNTEGLDPLMIDFLAEVPQHWGDRQIDKWFSDKKQNYIVYENCIDGERKNLYIKVVDIANDYNIYIGLYEETGGLFDDQCLIMWNKDYNFNNVGYAPGRCPDVMPKK